MVLYSVTVWIPVITCLAGWLLSFELCLQEHSPFLETFWDTSSYRGNTVSYHHLVQTSAPPGILNSPSDQEHWKHHSQPARRGHTYTTGHHTITTLISTKIRLKYKTTISTNGAILSFRSMLRYSIIVPEHPAVCGHFVVWSISPQLFLHLNFIQIWSQHLP